MHMGTTDDKQIAVHCKTQNNTTQSLIQIYYQHYKKAKKWPIKDLKIHILAKLYVKCRFWLSNTVLDAVRCKEIYIF